MTCVMLATPSFERRPCVEYVVSMCDTQRALHVKKIDYIVSILGGDPYLGKVRNTLVRNMLADYPDVTDLFFIDDDMGWPSHKVIEFIERPEDVICGFYPKKQDGAEWPGNLASKDGKPIMKDGLYLAHLVPTGFMRIKRHVLEKMAQYVPKYFEPKPDGSQAITWNIFEAKLVDLQMDQLRRSNMDDLTREEAIAHLKRAVGRVAGSEIAQFWGEDFYFAERWREMGGEIWVDPDVNFSHRGSKAWVGNFMDAVKQVAAA
jgi:hypothetical protein